MTLRPLLDAFDDDDDEADAFDQRPLNGHCAGAGEVVVAHTSRPWAAVL